MRYRKIEGAEKLRSFIHPMLAQPTEREAFNDPAWIFEIKWDGYRAVAEVQKNGVRLYSRNGLSFAKAYPKVYRALSGIGEEMILDGEIVVFDADDKPSFQKLQNYNGHSRDPICYYVFDCLSIHGKDVTRLPLQERKALLKKHLKENDFVKYCDHIPEEGKSFFEAIRKQGLEGMIAKRIDSLYEQGKRTGNWLKIRNILSEEAIIVGYTSPKGSRKGFGSLLLAQYHRKKLTYIGNVGTGFTSRVLDELHSKLKPISRTTSPLDVDVKVSPDTTWVDPLHVCQVKFTEKTSEGILRHPVFLGLRVDKNPADVTG